MLMGGSIMLPFDDARATLSAIFDIATRAPDELYLTPSLIRTPDGGRVVVVETCYCGPVAAGETQVAPLLKVGKVIGGRFAPTPYVKLQQQLDTAAAPGRRYYYKSGFVKKMSEALIDELVGRFEAGPPALKGIPMPHVGGAISRVPTSATACWNRVADFDLLVQGAWDSPDQDGINIETLRALWKHLETFTEGFYVNTDAVEDARRLRATYGDNYERLVALKKKYDPTNLFRLNANIPPGT
jgi:hypothetical protein